MANKRGVGVLVISALSFLIAMIVFFHSSSIMPSGGKVKWLGELETNVFQSYYLAESELLYLDIIADQSLKHVISKNKDLTEEECLEKFKENFNIRLKNYDNVYSRNLTINDYFFELKDGKVIGLTNKELNISKPGLSYLFKPNFKTRYKINCLTNNIQRN